MDILPEVVEVVKGKVPVFIDGSFYRGTDVIKAIALGATAVGIGRLYCYALAAAGRPGIVRMLELLEDEMKRDLGLMGCDSIASWTNPTCARCRRCGSPTCSARITSATTSTSRIESASSSSPGRAEGASLR